MTVVCPGFVQTPMSASLPVHGPFMWTADRAARYIVRRLARGDREIAFPLPLALATRLSALLPTPILDLILRCVNLERINRKGATAAARRYPVK